MQDSEAPRVPKDLETHSSFFYIAMSLMLSRNEHSVVPEVMYFMNTDQILKFCQMFGGSRIYVPTTKELGTELLCALAAYYRLSLGLSWDVIGDKLKVDGRTLNSFKSRIAEWQEHMKELNVDVSDALLYVKEIQ